MINENIARGNLTDDELETTKGDMGSIAGLIQQKYGTAQEEVRKKLNDWLATDTSEDDSQANRRPA